MRQVPCLAEPVSPVPSHSMYPWMEIATAELSVTQTRGKKNNPRVVEMQLLSFLSAKQQAAIPKAA
jgi:hypothetical protein